MAADYPDWVMVHKKKVLISTGSMTGIIFMPHILNASGGRAKGDGSVTVIRAESPERTGSSPLIKS